MKKESIFCIGKVTGESLVLFWRKLYYVPVLSDIVHLTNVIVLIFLNAEHLTDLVC